LGFIKTKNQVALYLDHEFTWETGILFVEAYYRIEMKSETEVIRLDGTQFLRIT